jgi:O-antigen ligase
MFRFRLLENAFVIFTFLVLTGAGVDLLNESQGLGSMATAHPVSRLLSMVMQVGVIFLVLIWRKQIWRVALQSWWLWAFLSLVIISTFWSEFPVSTFRNSIFLLQISLFAMYLVARFTLAEQLELITWTFGIAIALSFLVAVFVPSVGVMGLGQIFTPEALVHKGTWRGIFIHKNFLGRIMTLSTLIFLVQPRGKGWMQFWRWAGIAGSILLVLLSTSKTSLIVLTALIALVPLFRLWRLNYSRSIPFFIALTLMGSSGLLLLLNGAEEILGAVGRDITLTGRTELWDLSLGKIFEHPLLGYGYTGFWRYFEGESAELLLALNWEIPHSHNGLIDLTLDLGLVGLLLFLVGFAFTSWRAIHWIRITEKSTDIWPLAFLAFMFLANLTESSLLRQNLLWVLYVSVALTIMQKHPQRNRQDFLPTQNLVPTLNPAAPLS